MVNGSSCYTTAEQPGGKRLHAGVCLWLLFLTVAGFEQQQMLTYCLAGPVRRLGYWSGTELSDFCVCFREDQQAPYYFKLLPSLCCDVNPYSLFLLWAPFFECLSSSDSLLTLPIFCCSSKSSSLASLLNYWDRLKQLLSALRQSWGRQKRKKETKKKGRYGGQIHPCLKRGFCREPRAGCQVCRWCTAGTFLTLWE